MQKKTYFIKSIPKGFEGIYRGTDSHNKPVVGQTVEDILKTMQLQPNVDSFWLDTRICFSVLSTLYPTAFRPQGIIFTLRKKNSDMRYFGHDLLALVKNYEMFESSSAQNLSSLHQVYNNVLIEPTILDWQRHRSMAEVLFRAGNDKFQLEKEHKKPFTIQEAMMHLVNTIREKSGYQPLSADRIDKFQTNEVFSYQPVEINPVAIYADHKTSEAVGKAWKLAKANKVPFYGSLHSFLNEHLHNYSIEDSNDTWTMKTKSQIIEMLDKNQLIPGIQWVLDPEETIQDAMDLVNEGMKKNNIKIKKNLL